MRIEEFQAIVNAASETAEAIVGAREWATAEDASAMYDLIFWDMLAKKLPNISIAYLQSNCK
jgi:hypothetical protein